MCLINIERAKKQPGALFLFFFFSNAPPTSPRACSARSVTSRELPVSVPAEEQREGGKKGSARTWTSLSLNTSP